MASRWVKAAFLALIGLVLLIYADGFVTDLQINLSDQFNVSFDWTWDLLKILIWILVAWLFVDAALIVALSFKGDLYTLTDVMARLRVIEKKLGPPKAKAVDEPLPDDRVEPPAAIGPAVTMDDEPPPPPGRSGG
jgi:hypothetical protein